MNVESNSKKGRTLNLYNEHDPFAAQWLRNLMYAGHIPKGTVDARSIKDLKPADVAGAGQRHFFAGIGVWSHALRLAGWPDDRPVWTGSCPCQPFSVAGRGLGIDDPRHLWPVWFELIKQCRPPVVFGEQVASADGLAWLDAVRADLEGAGYAVGAADLCAAGVGAPHIRQRLYFVGVAQGGLAHHHQQGRRQLGRVVPEDGHAQPGADADGRGEAGGVADAGEERRRRGADLTGRERDGADTRRPEGVGVSESRRIDGGLADDGCEGRRQIGSDVRGSSEGSRAQGVDERSLYSGAFGARGLGEPNHTRLEGLAGHGNDGHQPGRNRAQPYGPTPTSGFWGDPDWVDCRDGKRRPVEPGTFPLAHGAPARVGPDGSVETQPRVGKLRAYGNAIVAPVAATFIRAVMESINATDK